MQRPSMVAVRVYTVLGLATPYKYFQSPSYSSCTCTFIYLTYTYLVQQGLLCVANLHPFLSKSALRLHDQFATMSTLMSLCKLLMKLQ